MISVIVKHSFSKNVALKLRSSPRFCDWVDISLRFVDSEVVWVWFFWTLFHHNGWKSCYLDASTILIDSHQIYNHPRLLPQRTDKN